VLSGKEKKLLFDLVGNQKAFVLLSISSPKSLIQIKDSDDISQRKGVRVS